MIGTAGKLRMALASVALCAGLAACADDVEIKSPMLNTVAASLGAGSKAEPQLADRPGLVVPPATAALPQPGSGQAVTAQISAQLPNGGQQSAAAVAAAEKKKEQDAACQAAADHPKDSAFKAGCPGLIAKLWAASQGQTSQ